MAHAAIRADPQISMAVFKQGAGAGISKSIPLLVTDDASLRAFAQKVTEPSVCGCPDALVPVLSDGADKGVR